MRTFAQKSNASQQTVSAMSMIPSRATFGQSRDIQSFVHVPRTISNQALQRLLKSRTHNLESVPANNESLGIVQKKTETGIVPEIEPETEARIRGLHGSGRELPAAERAFFEPRFGHDFSQVRVHTGAHASETVGAVNARAFTVGRDIVFGTGQYSNDTPAGRRLLAHELTHTIQQGAVTNTHASGGLNNSQVSEGVSGSSLQRVADKSNMPNTTACNRQDPAPGRPTGTHIMFGQNDQTLDGVDTTLIAAEYASWNARGGVDTITVDGFASTEGGSYINWIISCNRAEVVKAEFIRLGVPDNMVITVAHGETEEFSPTTLPANRQAVISMPQFVLPTPPSTCPPGENCCPTSITESHTLTTDCTNGIVVAANNIRLDCAGHTLTGSAPAGPPDVRQRDFSEGINLTDRTGVTVTNCRVTNFGMGFALRNATTNTFTNNRVFGNARDGFDLNDSNSNTFINNTVNGNDLNGIELDRSQENIFIKNIVNGNEDGFDLDEGDDNSPRNVFTSNIANENRRDGFRIRSDGNTFTGNIANNNEDGFHIEGTAAGNVFTQNTANSNREEGFDLQLPACVLTQNTAIGNTGDGFQVRSNNNIFTDNTANSNGDEDLDVGAGSTGNTCRRNTFANARGRCLPQFR